jgi:hypothetical protein
MRGDERMLWLVQSLKLVCEVALMALAGRAVLRLWIGPAACAGNPFHRLLGWIVWPLERRAGRWTLPLLLAVWLGSTAAKIHLCLAAGALACR